MPVRILIVGAGAIGAFYGSRLACASNTAVSALCRSNFNAVKTHGFKVISSQFDERAFVPEHVFPAAENAREARISWDYLLVSTKALPDVSDDSALLEGLVGPETCIVLIQNGLGIEEPYQKRFPRASVLSGVTLASAAQPQPGTIQHHRWTKISLGPYLPHVDPNDGAPTDEDQRTIARAHRLVELLRAGGIADAAGLSHAGLQFARWHKVAINAAMNPASVLSGGSDNPSLAADPELARHLRGVMDEVLETAPRLLGQPLPPGLPTAEQILASTRNAPPGSRPSMWTDWHAGTPMELEVILGNPIRMAREKGLDMPRLQTVYALVKMLQANRDARNQSRI